MGHIGVSSVRKKAETLWEKRREEIEEKIESIEKQIEKLDTDSNELTHQQSEAAAQLRILERNTTVPFEPTHTPENQSKGPFVTLLIFIALALGIASFYLPPIYETIAHVLAVTVLAISLTYIPSLLAEHRANAFDKAAQITNSPEYVRKHNTDTINHVHAAEIKSDNLKSELEATKKLLEFSYV